MERLDALRCKLQGLKRFGRHLGGSGIKPRLGDAQILRALKGETVELVGVGDDRVVALCLHLGDNGRHVIVDVHRGLALGGEQFSEGCFEIFSARVEAAGGCAGGHGGLLQKGAWTDDGQVPGAMDGWGRLGVRRPDHGPAYAGFPTDR